MGKQTEYTILEEEVQTVNNYPKKIFDIFSHLGMHWDSTPPHLNGYHQEYKKMLVEYGGKELQHTVGKNVN